ncbi:MAG: FHA domain-containing protein [Caldimonas sp.]
MSLKSWVLDRVHQMNGIAGRNDLPSREPDFAAVRRAPAASVVRAEGGYTASGVEPIVEAEHLGAYAPLIGAIREELEHFVASHVRLHVVIADRDRFVLTSIGVRCGSAAEARPRLQRFMQEFKPEQVKRYIAREVIGSLPNASSIDLSQFAGLFDADARTSAGGDEYGELLAALRTAPHDASLRPYEVSVQGRWTEAEAARGGASSPSSSSRGAGRLEPTPSTPLAGQRHEFEVEDADGRRRVALQSVVPGRRYVVGKGEGCDIRVNGTYTSRRHAEIWREHDAWWVADAGSTNGLRVESQGRVRGRVDAEGVTATATGMDPPVRLDDDARIVLSARAEGPRTDYPSVSMRAGQGAARAPVPAASSVPIDSMREPAAAPRTPLTAVLPLKGTVPTHAITVQQASGAQTRAIDRDALPLSVGRSRNQALVIDRRHEEVSGHHLDVVALDEDGAEVMVLGDNGIVIDGRAHAPGARCRWRVGSTMVLGAPGDEPPACTLALTRKERV